MASSAEMALIGAREIFGRAGARLVDLDDLVDHEIAYLDAG
jgi:hypothetical protein